MKSENGLNIPWLFTMAWRDSRRNRSRLLLFISSIILGIAAMVAIYSLGENMREEVDRQAASLLGADLEIGNNREIETEIRALLDSIGDQRSEQQSFTSMIYFPKAGGTRLVQVRALKGGFPYYGELETQPAGASRNFQNTASVLVDQTVMLQFNAKPGDTIRLGNLDFRIAGSLISAPGQTGLSASVAPVVFMPLEYLEQTGLSQKGSRISYRFYYKFNKSTDVQKTLDRIGPTIERAGLDYETVQERKEDTTQSLADLTRFLSLISFIALLLGCIGVASAIHIYVREKINAVAILRCLGVRSSQAFMIYLIQILVIGFIGSLAGALLGTLIQQALPIALKDLIPVSIDPKISWKAIGQGLLLGIVISFLFALLPLISIRRISPLNTLRLSDEANGRRDPLSWLVYAGILVFIFGFACLQLNGVQQAIFFTIGVVIAFLILTGIASLLMWAARKFFPEKRSYLARQGLANLFRPNNQTAILIVAIGLGTAFICTMFSVQSILLNRVKLSAGAGQSNTVLFDIQPAQRDSLIALTKESGLPVSGTVPIVNMRLERINQVTVETLEKDSTLGMHQWIFDREYRVTFRDSLTSSEKLVKGKWNGEATPDGPVFISLEQRFARNNNIEIGDTMVFNVQGSIMNTIVGSFREVDWNRIQTNFLVVFPKGVLEEAPQFHVLLTRIPDRESSARFQQLVVKRFPNVSVIDLTLVLDILDNLLDKVGFVIRFMAGFSIFTGLIVLIASVLISKYQRIQESVLLRTLGGSRKQILYISALEYFFLGALAAATGLILSLGISWLLARFIFETSFTPPWGILLLVMISVCLLTVFIGLINSRSVLNRPPLEILREEV